MYAKYSLCLRELCYGRRVGSGGNQAFAFIGGGAVTAAGQIGWAIAGSDTVIFSHVLYQLSYLGAEARQRTAGPRRAVYRGSVLSRQGGFGGPSRNLAPAAQSLRRSRLAGSGASESSSDSTAGIA